MAKYTKNSIYFSPARKEARKHGYRSGLELRTAWELENAKIAFEYEPKDNHLEYFIKSKAVCNECGSHDTIEKHLYVPDFFIISRGYKIVLEAKGNLPPQDAKKMIAVKNNHPDIEFVFLFMKDGKIGRGRYSDYCEKYGFAYFFEGKDKEKLISYLKRK